MTKHCWQPAFCTTCRNFIAGMTFSFHLNNCWRILWSTKQAQAWINFLRLKKDTSPCSMFNMYKTIVSISAFPLVVQKNCPGTSPYYEHSRLPIPGPLNIHSIYKIHECLKFQFLKKSLEIKDSL